MRDRTLAIKAPSQPLMTHCVADAWDKLHREHSSLVQKSFQQDGIALDPEGSEDHLLSVRDLPNLAPEIGDRSVWEEGGLNCNLEPLVMINGRKGKSHTGNGLLKDDDWPKSCVGQRVRGDGT
jgi:hypothetical protein